MNKTKLKRKRWLYFFAMICIVSLTTTGCASLRKKFTRTKKKTEKRETFVPVLEPVDYGTPNESAVEQYQAHMTVVKAFLKDVEAELNTDTTAKRQLYLLTQVTLRLEMMVSLLQEEKAEGLKKIIIQIDEIKLELDKPQALRRYDLLSHQMSGLAKDIRQRFKGDEVKDLMAFK